MQFPVYSDMHESMGFVPGNHAQLFPDTGKCSFYHFMAKCEHCIREILVWVIYMLMLDSFIGVVLQALARYDR